MWGGGGYCTGVAPQLISLILSLQDEFVWHFYILICLKCYFFQYFVGTSDTLSVQMTCLSANMYRQISKCTDKTPKKVLLGGGGGQLPPCSPPPPRSGYASDLWGRYIVQYHYLLPYSFFLFCLPQLSHKGNNFVYMYLTD